MVTDLVDQHVADDAVHRLAGPVGVTEDGDTVRERSCQADLRDPIHF